MRTNANVRIVYAACNVSWPLLARQIVRKVAERRHLGLILTAQTERRIAEVSGRPLTSASASTLSQLVPPLQAAAEKEKTFNEDVFQAQICVGWIHSTVGNHTLALSTLPPTFDRVSDRLSRDGGITARWTHVCIVKGAYLRGMWAFPYCASEDPCSMEQESRWKKRTVSKRQFGHMSQCYRTLQAFHLQLQVLRNSGIGQSAFLPATVCFLVVMFQPIKFRLRYQSCHHQEFSRPFERIRNIGIPKVHPM